ncbi:MAG: polysaccharide deacetylase family protein [Anaerolineales bacterium]|nr:polysaccharide deacetylase family protein [Anaerolineales bacterium]
MSKQTDNRKLLARGAQVLALMGLVVSLAACGGQAAEPTAVPEPTSTPTAAPTDTPTPAPTDTPTATPVPTDTPTVTPVPTDTPTPTPEPATGRPPASPDIVYIGNPTTPDGDPQVNISFDVQGDPATLYQILDILDQYGVRTTFFMQGEWVEQYPDAAKEIANRGHELGNHSWTHFNFSEMTAEEVTKELNDTEAIVKEVTGQTTKPYFRPPFGSRSTVSLQTAYDLGYTTIIWTYGADEWRDGATAQTIFDNVYGNKAPGALYYTHTDRQIIVDALPRVIEAFQADGYKLVTAGEILAAQENN